MIEKRDVRVSCAKRNKKKEMNHISQSLQAGNNRETSINALIVVMPSLYGDTQTN